MKREIRRILIANRGEIACRVIRTCKKLSIATVAVYSECDRDALFVRMADEAVFLGPSLSSQSYLCADKIISAAKLTHADAIHPGYGFLSENADFSRKCWDNQLVFIGPRAETILSIGDKSSAKILLKQHAPTVPTIPGYNDSDQSVDRLVSEAISIGFPVLLKASAGGGGKGMRIVRDSVKLREEIEMAKGEALRSFGNDSLLIEKYFENVKHIEVQIMGDQYGNVYHCFERECSVQRRHQKVIEEAPSPSLTPELRDAITLAAVTIGKLLAYEGAGTVEFILDTRTRQFYFLEVNTRLQVEHPITEAITGLDLVELQIHVASGVPLTTFNLDKIRIRGHAIESRLYAEDPNNNFFPCTGTVLLWDTVKDGGERVRYDTGIETGSQISVYYDPLISKITTWGPSRTEAIRTMERTLQSTACLGLITNKECLLRILLEQKFVDGSYTTRLIESMNSLSMDMPKISMVPFSHPKLSQLDQAPHRWHEVIGSGDRLVFDAAFEAAAIFSLWSVFKSRADQGSIWNSIAPSWSSAGVKWRPTRDEYILDSAKIDVGVEYVCIEESWKDLRSIVPLEFGMRSVVPGVDGNKDQVSQWSHITLLDAGFIGEGRSVGQLRCSFNGLIKHYLIAEKPSKFEDISAICIHSPTWPKQVSIVKRDPRRGKSKPEEDAHSSYQSTMPCRILKLLVGNGSLVEVDTPLLTMESMKMETRLYSRHKGHVTFLVREGDVVEAGTLMVSIK